MAYDYHTFLDTCMQHLKNNSVAERIMHIYVHLFQQSIQQQEEIYEYTFNMHGKQSQQLTCQARSKTK